MSRGKVFLSHGPSGHIKVIEWNFFSQFTFNIFTSGLNSKYNKLIGFSKNS